MLLVLTSRETPTAMATMATTMLAALLRAPRLTWILRTLKKVPEYIVMKKGFYKVSRHNWISIISPPWHGFTYPFLPSLLIKSEKVQFSFFCGTCLLTGERRERFKIVNDRCLKILDLSLKYGCEMHYPTHLFFWAYLLVCSYPKNLPVVIFSLKVPLEWKSFEGTFRIKKICGNF